MGRVFRVCMICTTTENLMLIPSAQPVTATPPPLTHCLKSHFDLDSFAYDIT